MKNYNASKNINKYVNENKPSNLYMSFEESIYNKYINILNNPQNYSEKYKQHITSLYIQSKKLTNNLVLEERDVKEELCINLYSLKTQFENHYNGVRELLLYTIKKDLNYIKDKVAFINHLISYKNHNKITVSEMLTSLRNKFKKPINIVFNSFEEFITKLTALYNKYFPLNVLFN